MFCNIFFFLSFLCVIFVFTASNGILREDCYVMMLKNGKQRLELKSLTWVLGWICRPTKLETSFSASFSSCFMDFFQLAKAWKDFLVSLFAVDLFTESFEFISFLYRLKYMTRSWLEFIFLIERNWVWTSFEHSRVYSGNIHRHCHEMFKEQHFDERSHNSINLTIYLTGLTFRFLLWTPLAKRYYKQQSEIEKERVC